MRDRHFGTVVLFPVMAWHRPERFILTMSFHFTPRRQTVSVSQFMANQYANPSGLFGRFVTARLLNNANKLSNAHVLSALDLQPDSTILEVGFGGGDLLLNMATTHPSATLNGVEYSTAMIERLGRKLGRIDRDQPVTLSEGVAQSLPFPNATFDRVCSVNTIYFWPELDSGFREIARVTQPGGIVVLGFGANEQLRDAGYEAKGFKLYPVNDILDGLTASGFDIDAHEKIQRETRGVFNVLKCIRRGAAAP